MLSLYTYLPLSLLFYYTTKSSSAAERTRCRLGKARTCPQGAFRHKTKLSSAAGRAKSWLIANDDFVIFQNPPYGQVLVLPSQHLVHPAAEDDFFIC